MAGSLSRPRSLPPSSRPLSSATQYIDIVLTGEVDGCRGGIGVPQAFPRRAQVRLESGHGIAVLDNRRSAQSCRLRASPRCAAHPVPSASPPGRTRPGRELARVVSSPVLLLAACWGGGCGRSSGGRGRSCFASGRPRGSWHAVSGATLATRRCPPSCSAPRGPSKLRPAAPWAQGVASDLALPAARSPGLHPAMAQARRRIALRCPPRRSSSAPRSSSVSLPATWLPAAPSARALLSPCRVIIDGRCRPRVREGHPQRGADRPNGAGAGPRPWPLGRPDPSYIWHTRLVLRLLLQLRRRPRSRPLDRRWAQLLLRCGSTALRGSGGCGRESGP